MKRGLLLGKFMPFHYGHVALVNFALAYTDSLTVLVCANKNEPIDGKLRCGWVKNYYAGNNNVDVVLIDYDDTVLSSASISSEEASQKWTDYLKEKFPDTNVFISSEKYGEYVAAHWGIHFLCFDEKRQLISVSATNIRTHPFKNWMYIPSVVRSYFTKKICIAGSESTGKSILAGRLATYYKTVFVPEMARDIIEKTGTCTLGDLYTVATLHAKKIIEKNQQADKLLFVDTDINITRSYGRFLFDTAIVAEDWINKANRFDLYLFLETDCPFVQDGTRLEETDREKLSLSHKNEFEKQGIFCHTISGDWEQRFNTAVKIIDQAFFEEIL